MTEKEVFYYFERGYKDLKTNALDDKFVKSKQDKLFERQRQDTQKLNDFLKVNPKKTNVYCKDTSVFATFNHRTIEFTIDQEAIFFWSKYDIVYYELNK